MYVNVSFLEILGFDFVISYKIEIDFGNFIFMLNVIYIIKYDLMDL